MMKTLATALLVLALAAGCGSDPRPPHAMDPWVREPAPGMQMLAGYLVLHNPSDRDLELESAGSPDFAAVEFHNSVIEDGVSRMRQESRLTVPAGGSLAFEPGGRHLMLINPARELTTGDLVTIELSFADGSLLNFTAPVRASGGGHSHHH